MVIKPRVIVANPPFAEDGNTQQAARFIKKALNWLEKGSQVAFVLPQSFLTNQVLEISHDNTQILLYLSGLLDDEEEAWLPILPEMPGWALDGTVFEAELSEDVETFEQLSQHPWAIRRFRHTPYPYLTNEELTQKLRIDSMEERL
ncbi:MAG: hypothetical protein AN487_19145 [Anabaena sp. CRKS33]|jgi:hypothetical protein|nr:MAG: hypothetical protein AN487_19145 [Anabaena sp. CRKS33]